MNDHEYHPPPSPVPPRLSTLRTDSLRACRFELFLQVKALNKRVCELMGFDKWQSVSGQTYSRKIDYQVHVKAVVLNTWSVRNFSRILLPFYECQHRYSDLWWG